MADKAVGNKGVVVSLYSEAIDRLDAGIGDRCDPSKVEPAVGELRSDRSDIRVCDPAEYLRPTATPPRQPVRAEALALLQALHAAPGRQWPELHSPAVLAAAALPARWLATAIDLRPRLRPLLFRREAPAGG
jgi:hypothetical protein